MNVNESSMYERQYDKPIALNEIFLCSIFGSTETLLCFDTCQFEDYSKIFAPRFNIEKKVARRKEIFPTDCQKAFAMGAKLVTG